MTIYKYSCPVSWVAYTEKSICDGLYWKPNRGKWKRLFNFDFLQYNNLEWDKSLMCCCDAKTEIKTVEKCNLLDDTSQQNMQVSEVIRVLKQHGYRILAPKYVEV